MRRRVLRSGGPIIYNFRSEGATEGLAKPLFLSITEMVEILGSTALAPYDVKKTWAIKVPPNMTSDEVVEVLKAGKYTIKETERFVYVIPKFD
jgi:hypothetical protein